MSYFTYSGGIFLFMDAVIDFVAGSKCVLAKARVFLRLTPNICDATIFYVLEKFAGNFSTKRFCASQSLNFCFFNNAAQNNNGLLDF